MSGAAACCCGGCKVTDCLSSDLIDSGCCHACDELLLWCERPGYSFTQQAVSAGILPGSPKCQWNYTVSQAAMPPVQAVYKYHGNYWRCEIPPTTPESLYTIPSRCPPDWNVGAGCYDPSLYLCNGSMSHCNDPSPPVCLCNSTWLTPWRKSLLAADPATHWLTEMTCFKGGASLSASVGSLYNTFLCVVHLERWWKIPQESCDPEGYLLVPNCTTSACAGACGTVSYSRTSLVPKWWIYACSGVPLFTWDLDDAVTRGIITTGERTSILTSIGAKLQPDQALLVKLATGGYFDTRDWRADQQQAFADLDAKFPGAGYAGCIASPSSMAPIGPVRRRLCAPYTNPPTTTPWLDRADAEASQQALNVGAACFIAYPGAAGSASDYAYWADRQWVYFRAVPGGWQWAGWGATAPGMTEIEAILNGYGRSDPTCIEALKGNPRPAPCCVDNTPVCNTSVYTPCSGCGAGSCACSPIPLVGCGPFSTTPVETQCENLVISPLCQGIRFAFAQYVNENQLTATESGCVQTSRYRCLYVAKSFLVEAKRSSDSWTASIPYQCRRETPPLHVFNAWPTIAYGHYGIAPICDSIIVADGNYSSSDLCCSGYCWDYRYVAGQSAPCVEPRGAHNDCPTATDCPPHSTAQQLACIGYTPACP